MEYCITYNTLRSTNDTHYELNNVSIWNPFMTTIREDQITSTTFPITTILKNNHQSDDDQHNLEMDIKEDDLDPFSNWQTESNGEERGTPISVYIVTHVMIGLIGVIFNGLY